MEAVEKIDFSKGDTQEAMDFLTQPGLVERIIDDFAMLGCIGEKMNSLLTYLVATSRIMEYPIACIIRGESAAGKSNLAENISKLIPKDDKKVLTRVTKQAFYYMGFFAYPPEKVYFKIIQIDQI
jgi:hypothetical protein